MNDLNLLNIQPHQVSRDLRGYSVFFYGEPKSGWVNGDFDLTL